MKQGRLMMLVAFIAVASPLHATNIVTNSSFNGSLAGWFLGTGTTFDATADATGMPGSGSARSATSLAGNTIAITQCIAAVPGNYTLSGKILIPGGQTTNGSGTIGVTWFGGSNCSSGPVLGFNTATVTTTGSFVSVSTASIAPLGTTFAFVNGQHLSVSSGTHIVNFDDIILDDGTPSNIPALEPLALAALTLMLVLAALGILILRR